MAEDEPVTEEELPPRVKAAEERRDFRQKLEDSGLGAMSLDPVAELAELERVFGIRRRRKK
jgi:hypothetical protein